MSGNVSFTGTETDRSFFVEAGAGSGKTTGLVARMINMVEEGIDGREIDISEICAITFTNAAAKEFYGRFRKKLTEEIELTADETKRGRCKKALENIDFALVVGILYPQIKYAARLMSESFSDYSIVKISQMNKTRR